MDERLKALEPKVRELMLKLYQRKMPENLFDETLPESLFDKTLSDTDRLRVRYRENYIEAVEENNLEKETDETEIVSSIVSYINDTTDDPDSYINRDD